MSQPPTVNTTRPDIFDLPVPPRRLPFTPSGEDPPLGCRKKEDDSLTSFPRASALFMSASRSHLDNWHFGKNKKKEETEESIPPSSQGQRTNGVSMSRTWAKTQTDPKFTYFNHYWYFCQKCPPESINRMLLSTGAVVSTTVEKLTTRWPSWTAHPELVWANLSSQLCL